MIRKRTVSRPGLGLAGSTVVGTRAGQFMFLGAQTPHDVQSGQLVRTFKDIPHDAAATLCTGLLMVDAPDERILAQGWQILANVADLLSAHGLSLDQIVHQRYFLQDIRDRAALEKVILAWMPCTRPSTTIVEAAARGVNRSLCLHADFIVAIQPEGYARENVSIPELDSLTAPFPLATRAGQYLFTTPVPGVDPRTGAAVRTFGELDAQEQAFADPPYTARGESIAAQQVMVFRHVQRILESQGTSLAWQLRQNGWLRLPMREFGPASRVRKKLFSGANTGPFTSLAVSALRHDDAHFEYSVIALIPPVLADEHIRTLPSTPHGIASYYVSAVRSGPFVITAGEVPVDTTVPHAVQRFTDLRGESRLLDYGRIHEEKPILAEAFFVYEKLKTCLESLGASMPGVMHQTIYLVNPSDYPAVERIATLFFGSTLPPSTVVPITGTSPYAEASIEIEIICLADAGRDQ